MGDITGLRTPPTPFEILDVEDTLKKLTKKEKVDLTAGKLIHHNNSRILSYTVLELHLL